MQEISVNSVKLIYDPETEKFQNQDYLRTKSLRKAKKRYIEWNAIRNKEITEIINYV